MEMLGPSPTAPFGAARLSFAAVRADCVVKGCPPGKSVHKWRVFRQIAEARSKLGVSDRTLTILNALLSFHPDTMLVSGAADLVVFPSNRQLALRAHGVAASTLRRRLAALVEAGLILRRDSPNGKRYARRSASGEPEQAFGFDLGPIVARAEEFGQMADSVVKERQILDRLREQATVARRDLAKMIAAGVEEGIDADWRALHSTFRSVVDQLPRTPSREVLEPLVRDLSALAATVLAILRAHVQQPATPAAPPTNPSAEGERAETESEISPSLPTSDRTARGPESTAIPIRFVVEACPDICDYSRSEIRTLRDLITTAYLVRSLLGVSPSAWREACAVMGEGQASIVIAAILQKAAAIKNPGGYLRTLTRRASSGQFSTWSMLMALTASRRRIGTARGLGSPKPFLPG